ncbi:MAG: hypothetical protein JXA51_04655 [Dehalococcoidales bacterium]|nr:hypothetical protein [Dehalococcoidales bacterium]
MPDGNGHKPISELEMDTAETCDGCEVPVTANCESCGMPMMNPEQYGGGNVANRYCVHCCNPDGRLKNYEEVLEGMVQMMMDSRGMDRAAAETAAGEYLSTMPAWSSR